eukprot:gnl/Spiro4/16308_TR8756_c0_g1_i1.p1 gnl/Spiro4/16308_TR8756_c0_g1~~gnl/Spiro4/16308_TR8756_c0_g1_i1.p1  ORF type:complete len:420 (+),score=61.63 gnl/Spiro4/16308_TR8756_c0_g1_i1:134-1393(+)
MRMSTSKRDSFFNVKAAGPGPGDYAAEEAFKARARRAPGHSIAKRVPTKMEIGDSPGPAAYHPPPERKFTATFFGKMTEERPGMFRRATTPPGPGMYDVATNLGSDAVSVRPASSAAKSKDGSVIPKPKKGFGGAPKFTDVPPVNAENPGPGAYIDPAKIRSLSCNLAKSFAKSSRPEWMKISAAPGPGNYRCDESSFQDGDVYYHGSKVFRQNKTMPFYSSVYRQNPCFTSGTDNVWGPGPGAYDTIPRTSKIPGGAFGLREMSERASTLDSKSVVPGPDRYNIRKNPDLERASQRRGPDKAFYMGGRASVSALASTSDAPGPGTYVPRQRNTPIGTKFGTAARKIDIAPSSTAAYVLPRDLSRGPAVSFPHSRRPSPALDVPGPGAYKNPDPSKGRSGLRAALLAPTARETQPSEAP